MMKRIGVFGIGSPFGADNIGKHVIELLKQKLVHSDFNNQIQMEYHDRPGIHLLEVLNHFKEAHLIDAIISNKPIGTIHRYDDLTNLQENNRLLSSHGLGVAEVLALGKTLHCLPDKIIIHGIEIDNSVNVISNDIRITCNVLADQIAKECTRSAITLLTNK